MDRKTLKLPFTLERTPSWVCPTCETGLLRIKKETFFKEESAASQNHSHEAWEPTWIEYVYSCLLTCSNDQCQEKVVSIGTGSVDEDYGEDENGNPTQEWFDYFKPKFFQPPLKLLDIPSNCPDSVSTPLLESFRLFFSAPNAASNNVRIALEELLTELKVKRFNVVKGKRYPINLHQRIGLIPAKFGELKDLILAIKWLGNAGSHAHADGGVTMDDVMDAYELTEHILHEIYGRKKTKLVALAKRVNKKKGPVKQAK